MSVACPRCKRVVPAIPGIDHAPCSHATNRKFLSAMEMAPAEPCPPTLDDLSSLAVMRTAGLMYDEELGGGFVAACEASADENHPTIPDPDNFVDLDGKTRHEGMSW